MAAARPPELADLLDAADAAITERAWKAFVARYSRLLLHTARSSGVDYDGGMDRYRYVLEELRRDDFRRLRQYAVEGRSEFTTWLVVVGRRLCADFHRQRYGRDRGISGESESDAAAVRRRLVDLVASGLEPAHLSDPSSETPEKHLRVAELSQILQSVVESLPARDRVLLKLRFEDDIPVREIAEAMGFPSVFHVYRRLKTLLGTLRRDLRDRGVEGPRP
jgi:RNA polymerase sigma factor (sigma-70 family)